jgi:hypothetical protein
VLCVKAKVSCCVEGNYTNVITMRKRAQRDPATGVVFLASSVCCCLNLQGAAFDVTHFKSRITHLLYTAINTTEHGQVSQFFGFTKWLTSSIQRLRDVLHDNQGIAAISHVHLP